MRHYITIFFLLIFGFSNAQIKTGNYFNYGRTAKGEQVIFLPDNHIQFIFGKDTIGGNGTKMKGMLVAMKYNIDNSVTPNEINIIFYDKITGKELKTTKGLYRQISDYSLVLAMSVMGSSRPKEINENNPDVFRLTLNCEENYINLLKLNEQKTIIGFVPETKVLERAKGIKETSYFQNGKLLNTREFQTKEVCEYNQNGKLTKRTLYNINGKPFLSELGFYMQVVTYTDVGQIEVEQYFKNENELLTFNGKVFPQTKYIYKDNNLIQIDRLINNDSLKLTIPSTTKFTYDTYGDQIDWEFYFADGSKKIDTLKTKIISNIHKWIGLFAIYHNYFQTLLYGNPRESCTMRSYDKVPKSEKYDIYLEFYLNDSLNFQRKFNGFFQLDYEFNVQSVSYKTEKTGSNQNNSWSSKDNDTWFRTFCRELTEEEIEKKELEEKKRLQEALNTLDEAIGGKNPDVKIEGDVDKKTLRKTRKAIKNATK